MASIYEELSGKIDRNASRASRDGARRDLGIVLFSQREDLRDLWAAAERCAALLGPGAGDELRAAVEKLRPLFGERAG
jgi:hypothetical protein